MPQKCLFIPVASECNHYLHKVHLTAQNVSFLFGWCEKKTFDIFLIYFLTKCKIQDRSYKNNTITVSKQCLRFTAFTALVCEILPFSSNM